MRTGFILSTALFLIILMNVSGDFQGWSEAKPYPPAEEIKYFSLGHQDTLADSFWIRALQDFSLCEQDRGGNNRNPEGAKMGRDRTPTCSKGWLFHTLNVIMELAPKFHTVARTGPLTLSVIVDDIDGATLLFNKAMQNFPEDWVIHYRAAYHYLIELEDRTKAAQLFLDSYKFGAPEWTPLLAAKLHEKEGRNDVALFILEDFLKDDLQETKNIDAATEKLKSLRQKKREP